VEKREYSGRHFIGFLLCVVRCYFHVHIGLSIQLGGGRPVVVVASCACTAEGEKKKTEGGKATFFMMNPDGFFCF
jgi:hypothetical protein